MVASTTTGPRATCISLSQPRQAQSQEVAQCPSQQGQQDGKDKNHGVVGVGVSPSISRCNSSGSSSCTTGSSSNPSPYRIHCRERRLVRNLFMLSTPTTSPLPRPREFCHNNRNTTNPQTTTTTTTMDDLASCNLNNSNSNLHNSNSSMNNSNSNLHNSNSSMNSRINRSMNMLEYVLQENARHQVVVWSKSYCPKCKRVKQLLRQSLPADTDMVVRELDVERNGFQLEQALRQLLVSLSTSSAGQQPTTTTTAGYESITPLVFAAHGKLLGKGDAQIKAAYQSKQWQKLLVTPSTTTTTTTTSAPTATPTCRTTTTPQSSATNNKRQTNLSCSKKVVAATIAAVPHFVPRLARISDVSEAHLRESFVLDQEGRNCSDNDDDDDDVSLTLEGACSLVEIETLDNDDDDDDEDDFTTSSVAAVAVPDDENYYLDDVDNKNDKSSPGIMQHDHNSSHNSSSNLLSASSSRLIQQFHASKNSVLSWFSSAS